ncbi:ferric reductase-like transmembrane domain-containing protein [Dactylosporangium vinaceum]|uniref:DMSO/TMAO reductase YedYZ heme-binding membrane subunit n=1 Tax=Dactylosporangium vinaceum TaxID=53362 RepID=A0ABV5MQI0_9ACTN|nr:ferric reductase-like transmembrane domain-containing protein [Dactylosporangium vinaceum]UAB96461.1 ferric reductase-like transmembrane domain-containing protein [Dactylosporangium vinaceum]
MVQPHPSGSGGVQSSRGRSTPGGPPSAVNVALAVLAGLLLLGVATGGGRETLGQLFSFLVFYCGVFTLVSLTLTVIIGLVATDRIILVARHRVWVQSLHRTLGIVAIACLALHIGTELAAARVGVFGALVPFVAAPFAVGAGTVAAYLMVMVMWTGIVRSRFAQTGRPWMWRPLHATAYLSWPVAMWHGLNAGRPPAVWVTASYLVLLFLVTAALGLRLSAERTRRQQKLAADRTTTEIAPVGRPEPAGYERRQQRFGSRFRWDAPPADQTWSQEGPSDLRAEYRREPAPVDITPVTAIPSYEESFVEPFAREERQAFSTRERPVVAREERPVYTAGERFSTTERPVYAAGERFSTTERPVYAADERFSTKERPVFSDDVPPPAYDERPAAPDPYLTDEYFDEPAPAYRGVATAPVNDDYDPYADYAERPSYVEPVLEEPLTLRDRFAARRAAHAAEPEADEDPYVADDTPTLVNLDTRRVLRQERAQAQTTGRRGRRYRDDDEDDVAFWNQIRGEAR